jgi:hypothetical protein
MREWTTIAFRPGLPFALLLVLSGAARAESQVFGAGVSQPEPVAIGDLLAHPQDHVGKTVRVDGRITDVCPKRGCWIDIAGEGSERVIRFKVADGEIVFPAEVRGKGVIAEGVFTRIELEGEEAVAYARHLAEEKDEPFDASKVKPPLVFYQIKGSGAVVH